MRFIVLINVPEAGIRGFIDDWNTRKPKDVKIHLAPHISAEPINGKPLLTVVESKKMKPIFDYCKSLEERGVKTQLIPIFSDASTSRELEKFYDSKTQAEKHNAKVKTRKLRSLGSTKNLTVLPLIDWRSNREGLKIETGVSYLVKTSDNTILLDAGLNEKDEYPSPLLNNMGVLGVSLNEIDTIFITHNHSDHVGGAKWAKKKTFSITGRQEPLGDIKVYTPTRMKYPGLKPTYTRNPKVLCRGVASTGTIARGMYFWGLIEEQSLVVNVEGKGLVIVVGCGHQTVPRLLDRVRALFDEPIYGIIGGLHYPVMGGPVEVYGYAGHKYGATGKPPWEHITVDELQANIELLKALNLKLVALSPHDSSEVSMNAFRDAFRGDYRDLRVGEPIIAN